MNDFDEYLVAGEPDKRERAYGWATAIGLQDVDGLKVSDFLLNTAKRNIEGEITESEARKIVDEYYETKEGHDQPDDVKEADKVSARIKMVINSPTFTFSPAYYLGLHKQIFEGVFKFAGQIREVELTKREWVLNGESVQYSPSCMIEDTLAYDFEQERNFKYKGLSEDRFVEHFSSFISGIWQIHPFREGNTRAVAVFAIKYLRSMGYNVTNDLFAAKSWYFRNALVRANYENRNLDVDKTQLPLEEFFKVLLYGYELELKNRYLRIGNEYGSPAAEAVKDLHRHDVVINGVINKPDVGINVGIKHVDDVINRQDDVINGVIRFTEKEELAVKAFIRDPKLSAMKLADLIGVKHRQAQRIIASLKEKAGLRREGARKNGRWVFGG